jgi:hypothetical protein
MKAMRKGDEIYQLSKDQALVKKLYKGDNKTTSLIHQA